MSGLETAAGVALLCGAILAAVIAIATVLRHPLLLLAMVVMVPFIWGTAFGAGAPPRLPEDLAAVGTVEAGLPGGDIERPAAVSPGALSVPGVPGVSSVPGVAGVAGPVIRVPAAPAPPAMQPYVAPQPARGRQTAALNGPRAAGMADQCTTYALDRLYLVTGLWMAVEGDAGEWGLTARQAGWTVGTVPAERSILVMPYGNGFEYWTYSGGQLARVSVHPEFGHVAWVERIDPTRNWVLVSDQNWDGTGARGARWVWIKRAPVQFIYSDR